MAERIALGVFFGAIGFAFGVFFALFVVTF